MQPTRLLRSTEIPQADSLANVRRVLEALSGGSTAKEQISEQTGISPRHVGYALAAARVLGWLGVDGTSITPAGRELLAALPGTPDERAHLRRAILGCDVVKEVAPDLFEPVAPTKEALARRLFRLTAGIGKETARRRAQTLLAWRSQVVERQLPLFPKRPRKQSPPAAPAAGEEGARPGAGARDEGGVEHDARVDGAPENEVEDPKKRPSEARAERPMGGEPQGRAPRRGGKTRRHARRGSST